MITRSTETGGFKVCRPEGWGGLNCLPVKGDGGTKAKWPVCSYKSFV